MQVVAGFEHSLARDPNTGAVINVDKSSFEAFRAKALQEKSRDRELSDLKFRMDHIESRLDQILSVLERQAIR